MSQLGKRAAKANLTFLLLGGLAGTSCGTADDTGDTPAICSGEQALNYDTFGAGFLSLYCQGCHASDSLDRYGAPENVIFDNVDQALAQVVSIRATTLGESPTMPPGGGVPSLDLERLEVWLDCVDARDGR